MENIKNKKKSILINALVFNWLILFVLLIFIVAYLLPWFWQVSQNKNALLSEVTNYENIKKNWIDYQTFKTLVASSDKDLKNLVDNMWWDFFKSSLTNTSSWDYIVFLNQKEDFIEELKKEDFLKERDEKVAEVLPFYTEWVQVEWSTTELGFVNYIERLLRTFSLKTNSQIWIWNLTPVEDDKKTKTQWLSSQIFYTDIVLSLEWKRSDILDFLYFIQNVWNVSIDTNDDTQDVVFYKDEVLNKSFVWEKGKNIYENKIADIVSVDFWQYIDTSSSIRSENQKTLQWFISFIRSTPESQEAYSVNTTLRFYLRWLPTYKIDLFVQSVLSQFDKLSKEVKQTLTKSQNKALSKTNWQILTVSNNLKSLDTYMTNSLQKTKELKSLLVKKQNLDTLYYKASDLKYELDSISTMLEKNKLELDKTLNNK